MSDNAHESLPIRAVIFDLDGLLLNTEDLLTTSLNTVLARYGRPSVPRPIRVQMMGIPHSTGSDLFHDWAQLPITRVQSATELNAHYHASLPGAAPLPGAMALLEKLSSARATNGRRIHMALATGCISTDLARKTVGADSKHLLDFFPPGRRVLGDDERLGADSSKPKPDIFLLALEKVNESLPEGEAEMQADDCLVIEDSIAGVRAGRAAGMKVLWVPHPDLVEERGCEGGVLGDSDDGALKWARSLEDLKMGESDPSSTLASFCGLLR